ncbi:MAG: helicase-related protein, partial [Candidatus Nanopelagicaceae bacterium]
PHFLDRAWSRIKEEVAKGRQAYVVAPRISSTAIDVRVDASSEVDQEMMKRAARLLAEELPHGEDGLEADATESMASVEEFFTVLSTGPLRDLRIGQLHGRLTSEEKAATMIAFQRGELDLLISTTVIEVGVDVPNATVMVILDADRFGVSQLHQLRGRVGRGSEPGLCLLVTRVDPASAAMARLESVASTLDGFELSRIDLEQRREGDVLGVSQSGSRSHLRLLRVLDDEELIVRAREVATRLLDSDPLLATVPALRESLLQREQESDSAFVEKG